MIIGISGRKQSGKSTAANLIYSMYLSQLGISNKVYLSDYGEIIIEDLYGDTSYAGIFDVNNTNSLDITIQKAFDQMNKIVKVYSFADPLKRDICMNLLGLNYDQCYGTDEQKNTPTHLRWKDMPECPSDKEGLMTGREVMEFVGTNIFRKMYSQVWVEGTINRIKRENSQLAIICDCRFPNEVDAIRNTSGKVIRLTRNPFNSTSDSETALDENKYDWKNFDYVVDNTEFSLFDQSVKIKSILEEILQLS